MRTFARPVGRHDKTLGKHAKVTAVNPRTPARAGSRRRVMAGALSVLAIGVPALLSGSLDAVAAKPNRNVATPDPAAGTTTPTTTAKKIIGISAPDKLWSQRLGEVGACGVEARRIFGELQADGRSRSGTIEAAVKAGMMPVVSYKVPSVATLIAGGYDSWLTATKNYLSSLGVQVTATFWHEPYGDMTPAEFRAGSQRFLDRVKAPNVAVGPILNGWLLDRQVSVFASFTDQSLLTGWDFVGVDSYQGGTLTKPGPMMPARAVPLLAKWLDGQGFPDKRIGLGEYNGYSGDAMRIAGEHILSTPELWFGLAWDSTGDKYAPLDGDRLTAFRETKADARVLHEGNC